LESLTLFITLKDTFRKSTRKSKNTTLL